MDDRTIRNEVIAASQRWIANFNKGEVDACVSAYHPNAVMEAKPFGTFTGRQEIEAFWRPFIASGATDLTYQEVALEIIDETTGHLSARWHMNVGRGVITQEKWVKQANDHWLLTYDAFEVLEQFSPKP